MALVSIIIPVYNAERDLPRCLDSLLAQEFQDWEAIMVNDGSKDASADIMQAYSAKDARFVPIHQRNAGPGAARNAGLQAATGQYLQFVDADDHIPPGSTARLVEAMQGKDLAVGHFVIVSGDFRRSRGLIKQRLEVNRRQFLDLVILWPGSYYYSALWNKLYSRAIVMQQNLRFCESIIWGEDCLFNMNYYRYVGSACYIPAEVYQYERKVSGLSWGSVFNLHKGIRIKYMIYAALKRLYVEANLYYRYWFRVQLYILNVTLTH